MAGHQDIIYVSKMMYESEWASSERFGDLWILECVCVVALSSPLHRDIATLLYIYSGSNTAHLWPVLQPGNASALPPPPT